MSSTTSTYDNFTLSSFEQPASKYTVQRTESSSDLSRKEEDDQVYNLFLCLLKWIMAVFLFLAVLMCIVASKVCFLVLGQQFQSLNLTVAGNNTTVESAKPKKQALFIMLVLVLMIPQGVSFVYAMWTSLRRKSHLWPNSRGFLLIFIGGFLEAIPLCYIAIVMPTVLSVDSDSLILLMCSLVLAPAMWQIFKSRSKWKTKSGKFHVIKFVVAAVLALQGLVIVSWKIPSLSAKIATPLAFLLLSIAWSPKMRKLQTQPLRAFQTKLDGATEYHETKQEFAPSGRQRKTSRGKAAIILSLWKLVLTPLVALTFSKIYGIVDLDDLSVALKAVNSSHPSFLYFVLQVLLSYSGYHFGWLACSLCMQQIGYALPLTLATPFILVITHVRGVCDTTIVPLTCNSMDGDTLTLVAGGLLWLAQLLAATCYVWKSQGLITATAHALLWIPSYNGSCLEQNLLLNRRNRATDGEHVTQKHLSRDTNVFICTTMYHEEDYEMEQLLRSLHDIDSNSWKTGRHVESHIFFDGCVRAEVLNSFVLQLASLVEKTLKVQLVECTKMKTPYGMELRWTLPGGMDFTIHLKDNDKVKNKKRWSQVMYMSYVLDYKQRLLGVRDDQSFILTTDADVKFTHESMEALIDQITQDPRIGAVCARTHPLGSGPMVWYQVFDYAIGHWFQKVANHVFGSVLCSPGCFSLYRCQAVRDILPTYATGVDHAFEFLTKDMGEDRWMCTLMIQHGWLLTYCAAAEDSTYCPDNFEEFYKQRRRWTPSTLANLLLLVSQWKLILKNNEHISFFFIVYQTFLVCSTVIGPSTVILVIVGGLAFSGIGANELTTLFLLCIVVIAFSIVCLFTTQKFQLKIAKILTFVFAIIMIMVVIGVAVQISKEIKDRRGHSALAPTLEPNATGTTSNTPLEHHLPVGVSTLYLAGLTAIFIGGAALHPGESLCLLNGVWYLLCLPSGYLFLTVYSLCNLTDRSWGTREGKTASEGGDWLKPVIAFLNKWCCMYCRKKKKKKENSLSPSSNSTAQEGDDGSKTSLQTEEENSPDPKESSESSENLSLGTIADPTKPYSTDVPGLPLEDNLSDDVFEGEIPTAQEDDREAGLPARDSNSHRLAVNNHLKDVKISNDEFGSVVVYTEEAVVTDEFKQKNAKCSAIEVVKKVNEARAEKGEIKQENVGEAGRNIAFPLVAVRLNDTNDQKSGGPGLRAEEGQDVKTNATEPFHAYATANELAERRIHHNDHAPCNVSKVTSGDQRARQKQGRTAQSGSEANLTPGTSITTLSCSSLLVLDQDENSCAQSTSSESQWTSNSERPFKYGSDLSLRPFDENGHPIIEFRNEMSSYDVNVPIDAWLTGNLTRYIPNFCKYGYDKLGFLPGMTDKDLLMIGIETRGHRQRLLRAIRKLPRVDIEEGIPESVEDWLEEHGLEMYWPNFVSSGYIEPSDLEDLKDTSKDNLKEMFHVHKPGHCSKLLSIIRKLQYPNQGQMKVRRARRDLDRLPLLYMDVDNQDEGAEYEFWEGLRQACLIPELSAFGQNTELKEKLVELRNKTLLVFGISNALWMIIILTLVQHKSLKLLGVDVVGLGFLTVYGFIFLLQFLALLLHRFRTIIHVLARTPWKPTKQLGNSNRASFAEPSPPNDLPFSYCQAVTP